MKNLTALTAISIVLAIAVLYGEVDAAPYQELIPRKGFVPVYIRYGETPLSEIHPKLAEAFHEGGGHIESADLKKVNDSAEEASKSAEAQKPNTSAGKEDSDIASFDVVKGDGHEDRH